MMTGPCVQAPAAETNAWRIPGDTPRLPQNEVHVWRIDLTAQEERRLQALLTPQERARAARFRVANALRQFVVTRATLRLLLAGYLHVRPATLPLGVNAYGKPMLSPDTTDVRFNVSHTGTCALIAVTRGRRVGIDVERIRTSVIGERIAEHFFAAEELAALRALRPEEQAQAFFECWTCKEAFVKAVGRGLSIPLDAFVVAIGEPAALLEVRSEPREAARWTLHGLDPAPDHVGALAVEGRGLRLRSWQWSPASTPFHDADTS